MKYLRTTVAFLAGAMAAWALGMFLTWTIYPFWTPGGMASNGAGFTRYCMLWVVAVSGANWFFWKESDK